MKKTLKMKIIARRELKGIYTPLITRMGESFPASMSAVGEHILGYFCTFPESSVELQGIFPTEICLQEGTGSGILCSSVNVSGQTPS